MKKRIVSLLLVAMLSLSLAACGGSDTASGNNSGTDDNTGDNHSVQLDNISYNKNVVEAQPVELTAEETEALEGAKQLLSSILADYEEMKPSVNSFFTDYAKGMGRKYGSSESTKSSPYEELMYFLAKFDDYTQQETIYVTKAGDYHYISYVLLRGTGAVPDSNVDIAFFNVFLVKENGEWKLSTSEKDNAIWDEVYKAYSEKFNHYWFDEDVLIVNYFANGNFLFKDPYITVKNAVNGNIIWAAQEDNGLLAVELYFINGTDKDVVISNVEVDISDELEGTIYKGVLEGDPVLVKAGEGVLVDYTVPADKVTTGLKQWCYYQTYGVTDFDVN